jgi:O-antigen/teichoic acid export membrane protein
LLLVFHAGLEGIFVSGLIASAFTVVTLLPTIAKNFRWDFSSSLYRALLAFGLPYVPSGLAAIVIQVVDRPVMLYLTNKTTVGVYQANYRLGIFMMLIVSMFDYAWRPFFLSHAAEPGAKKMFARVLTYFVTATSFVLLVLSFFIGDIVRIKFSGHYLIHPSYWGGLSIVPVVLLAYLFLGVYNNLVAGIYIEKKTQKLPAITLAGAAANVAANFLLIPVMGMMGGAVATLLAYMVMAGALYVTVRQFYPVPYEWGRIGKVVLAGGIVEILFLTVNAGELRILWNIALLLLFGALLALLRFVDPEELQALRSLRHRGPAA